MRKSLIILLTAVQFVAACKDETLLDLTERELRIKAEREVSEQRTSKERWQLIALLCPIGCIAFLILGTAAGSKAKRDAARR